MKITLNEKLFEAKVTSSEEKNKTPDKEKKEGDKKTKKEPKDDLGRSRTEERILKDGSEYAKKLFAYLKDAGMVNNLEYEHEEGREKITFPSINKDRKYNIIVIKKLNLTNDSGASISQKDLITVNGSRAIKVNSFEDLIKTVKEHVEFKKKDFVPSSSSELVKEPKIKISADPISSTKKPETVGDVPLSQLPPTTDEGKPLPKEVTNPFEERSGSDSTNLKNLYNQFVEKIKLDNNFTISEETPEKNEVSYSKNNKPSEKHTTKFLNKNGKIFVRHGSRGNMSNTEIEDDDLSELFSSVGIFDKPVQSQSAPQIAANKKEEPLNPNRRMAPTTSSNSVQTPKKVETTKPSVVPPSLSRDQISKAFSSISNDQKAKQKPVEPPKEQPKVDKKNVNKSVNLDAPKVQKNEPSKEPTTVPPTVEPIVQKSVEPEVKNEPPVVEKPAASAVSDADISTKPEEQKTAEPISEPSAPPVSEPVSEPTTEQIPQEQPSSEQIAEPEVAPQNTFKHPDYKDEISGKDPYSTDRVKQNKQKLQNLNDTEFNIVVSKPFSLGKKSQAEDNGELYSRTVNVDAKGNVRYIFNLKFPEANKKLFEAVDKTNLQTTITKIINSFKNLKTKEIAITDFQNAEFDGLYVPKNILASVLVTTSKNIAKAPIAQIPLNPSDKQIKDISLNVTQKISEIIANDVSMEDSITKISFITTLSKSDRQPEEDLSGGTNIGRKVKPPQIPPVNEPVTQVQQDPSYKIDPNNTGVRKMAKQLGITGGDTVPNAQQGIPESEVYKNKAVFELYNPMVSENEVTTDQISSSPSFKLRDMKYRGLVNNAFYLESTNSLVFNLMPSQEKGFSVVSSPDSAFVFETKNGEKKFFSAEKGFKILGKNDKKELVPVSDFRKAGNLFYVILGNLPVIQKASFDPAITDQETNKEKVVDKTLQSIPQQNQGPATAVGKQKAIQPDTSPISTAKTEIAPNPTQQPSKPVASPQQNTTTTSKPNALSNLEAIRHFRKAILGHVRSNLPAFSEAFPKKSETLIKWLKDSQILPSGDPPTPEPPKADEPPEPSTPKKKGPGRPKGKGNKIDEARKDNNWERPSHQNWQNPNDEPLSVRSTNLRKQDYFGPGQNRRLEKDTVMYATKESDIIDGINDVFKGFTDKSLTRPIDLQPYLQKLESRKFFPIKVVKLENNMFFVKSDSSDKLFVIAPVGILYERVKNFYETPSATKNSRVLNYTNLASVPLDRANVSMSVIENHIKKGKCAVSETTY